MKCIILAAGYATRLYPITKNKPKSLLKINSKTILKDILDKIEKVDIITDTYLVTNDKFYEKFSQLDENINVLNDGTTSNENRLGAIADLKFVIEKEKINEDILVLASDNLFDFELTDFVNFCDADCITAHEINDIERLKRTGVIKIDENNKVIDFEEKPDNPKSNLAVPPFYKYKKETLPLIKKYLAEGNDPDAPGNFIPWLIKRKELYAFKFEGERYDIGTVESYQKAKEIFS